MLLVWIYAALLSFNVEYLTLPLGSLECLVDEAANVAVLDERGRVRRGGSKRLVEDGRVRRAMAASAGGGSRGGDNSASWGRKSKGKGKGKQKERDRERDRRKGVAHVDAAEFEDDWLAYVSMYGPGNGDRDMDLSWKQIWNQGTDAVMDVPIGGVCEVLYGDG